MANTIPTITLKQATLPQNSFVPQVYTPQTADVSLLANSLAQREARMEKASAQEAAFNETASKLETLVNPNEKQWVYDYLNKQSEGFKNALDAGDYGAAVRQATIAGSNLLKNPEAMGRIQYQEQFKKEQERQRQRVTNKEIYESTYNWWLHNNPYNYKDVKDDNGNIIGGTEYNNDNEPVKDMDFAAQALAAFKLLTPYKNTKSTGFENAGQDYNDTENTSWSRSGKNSTTVERITEDQILSVMDQLIKSNPDGYKQVEQSYDVSLFELENAEKEYEEAYALDPNSEATKTAKQKLDKRKELMYDNTGLISYEKYYARMVTNEGFAKGLAYDWQTTEHFSGKSNGKNARTGGSNNTPTNNPEPGTSDGKPAGTYVNAPNTEQETNTDEQNAEVLRSRDAVVSLFGGNNNKTK